MLTVEFPGSPKAHAIIIDVPLLGVSGVMECDICGCRTVLRQVIPAAVSDDIARFIKNHTCLELARRDEVIAFAAKLKAQLPDASVKVTKGQATIYEAR